MNTNWKDWIRLLLPPGIAAAVGGFTSIEFVEWMATLTGIVTLVPIITEFIKFNLNLEGVKWWFMSAGKWISWALVGALVVLSHSVGWGFESMSVLKLGLYIVGGGLVANGYYTIENVMYWLALITQNMDKVKVIEFNREVKLKAKLKELQAKRRAA